MWKFILYQFAGENPLGWHLANLVLHALNGFLLLFLSRRLYPATSPFARISIAGLFLIYPVVCHNVIWVSGSTDLLLTVWYLLALMGYVCYRQDGKRLWFYASMGALICAIFTKEMGLTLVPLLLIVDKAHKRCLKERLKDYLLIVLLVSGYFVLRLFALGSAVWGGARWHIDIDSLWRAFEYSTCYLRTLFLPWPLPVTMRHLPAGVSSFFDPYLGLLLVLLLLWLVIKYPKTQLSIALILLPMVIPVLLAFNSVGLFATRFLYLSVVGLMLLLVPLIGKVVEQRAFLPIYLLVLIFLSTLTMTETYKWVDQGAFAGTLIHYDSDYADNWLGQAKYYGSLGQNGKAIDIYRTAETQISTPREKFKVTESLAMFYADNGSHELSLNEFQKLKTAKGFESRGWIGIGNNLWMLGRLADAAGAYAEAVKADPLDVLALYNFGLINAQLKRFPAAIKAYEILSRLPPALADPNIRKQVELNLRQWKSTQSFK